jgi:O-antigen ligase
MLFGLVALFLLIKTRLRGEIILLAFLGLTIFLSFGGIIENFSLSGRSTENQEASSVTRKVLWQVGLAIAMDNPILGIGGDEYQMTSLQYTSSIDPALLEDRYWTYQNLGIGQMQVHNDFLRMWAYYGTIALLLFLWIMLVIMRTCVESFRTSRRKFIKGLSAGLAAGLIAYSINAFYHNVLADFALLWLIGGFSLALIKLAYQEKNESGYKKNGIRNYA